MQKIKTVDKKRTNLVYDDWILSRHYITRESLLKINNSINERCCTQSTFKIFYGKEAKVEVDGIYFVNLTFSDENHYLKNLIKETTFMYPGFDFKEKLEEIVFFDRPEDFASYLLKRHAINHSLEDKGVTQGFGVHIPLGRKSIIGVHNNHDKNAVFSTLLHELGHSVGHYRFLLYPNKYRRGYFSRGHRLWDEFLVNSISSYHIPSTSSLKTKHTESIIYLLKNKERYPEQLKQLSYFSFFSMSELFYYDIHGEHEYLEKTYARIRDAAGIEFFECFQFIYDELLYYRKYITQSYEKEHDYWFLNKLESYARDLQVLGN